MEYGTGREDRDDATLGSAPLASAGTSLPDTPFAPLEFDPAEFIQYLEDENLTEAEAAELLRVLWELVIAFVDLSCGTGRLQHLVDYSSASGGSTPPAAGSVVSSSSITDTFNRKTAGRNSPTVVEEDS